MTLTDHRKAIDKLDARIIRLLNERTRHVLQIGEIKIHGGEAIYVPHRERVVLQRICKLNQGPIKDESLRPRCNASAPASATRPRKPSPTFSSRSARTAPITAWCRWKIPPKGW
jgi:chorismate mutase